MHSAFENGHRDFDWYKNKFIIRKVGEFWPDYFQKPLVCSEKCSNGSDIKFLEEILKVSGKFGFELNAVDINGNTPLHLLCFHQCPTEVDEFLKFARNYDFDFEKRNKKGKTAWDLAKERMENEDKNRSCSMAKPCVLVTHVHDPSIGLSASVLSSRCKITLLK